MPRLLPVLTLGSALAIVATPARADVNDLPGGIVLSGYVQGQYEHHQDSEDQVRQGGALLNQDRFSIRRGRIKIEREWDLADLMLELDANTTKGPSVLPQHAEASLQYRGKNPQAMPPMLRVTFGLFDTPFGRELVESPRERFFMERSLVSRSFFPGEPDLGFRVSSALGWFRSSVAILNGDPLNDKIAPLRDPNFAKDIVARVGAEVSPLPWLSLRLGASVLNGKGFHQGTDATKNTVVWKDANEDGVINVGELQPVPGTAATPSSNFNRWAVGGDLGVAFKSSLGWTRIDAEVQAGSNMDRGLFIADPTLTGIDTRELGFMIGLSQEIFEYGVVGFRFDSYDPNGDSQDSRGGKLLPYSQTIRTFSPVVGVVLPPNRARFLFQYDIIKDKLGRDAQGVPTDLKNDAFTLRLQVAL